jgi:serine protease inhibitor
MGVVDIFESNSANFDGMHDLEPNRNLYVSKIYHKALIDVNENGTEAAAVTVGIASSGADIGPPSQINITCNRPFLFMIYERSKNNILFYGKILKL